MSTLRRRRFLQMASLGAFAGAGRLARGSPVSGRAQPKVVIVGGGFSGGQCALALRRADPAIEVILIDPDRHYVTCPMSNSVIAGLRSLESITIPRDGLARAGVRWVRDRAGAVDVTRRRVTLAGGHTIVYDKLVVAVGIRFLWGQPEGYDEAATSRMPHAWQAGSQTELLGAQLRNMRDGGVVAISVPAGPMRCPPGPFERASLIASYLKQHKPRSKVLIFDANNHFPKQDSFSAVWRDVYSGMIEWIPVVSGGAVLRVEPAAMILHTTQGTHRVDVANIIPPQAPARLAADAGLAAAHGWCPVKLDTFESTLAADVHVIGDACIAEPMPKSASAASSQAQQCAAAIAASLSGRVRPEPRYDSVCYSMVGPGRALSIHAAFRWADGAIQRQPEPAEISDGAEEPEGQAEIEARNAETWYQGIVAESFGGGRRTHS
jgi:sulfide dehydrogenase [flavocytochrome c] flavoprotein subunit